VLATKMETSVHNGRLRFIGWLDVCAFKVMKAVSFRLISERDAGQNAGMSFL
jgi:hypothetical protein